MVKNTKAPKPQKDTRIEDAVENATLLGILRAFALLSRREELQNLFGQKPTVRVAEAKPVKTAARRAPRGLLAAAAATAAASAAPAAAAKPAEPAAKPKKPTVMVTGEWMTIAAQGPDTVEPLRLNKAARMLTERLALKVASDEKLAETLAAALKPATDATMQEAGIPHPGYDAIATRLLTEAIGCPPAQATQVCQFLSGLGGKLMTAGWYQTIGEADASARVKVGPRDVLGVLGLLTGQLPRAAAEVAEALTEELEELARNAQQARILKAQSAASAAALVAGAAASTAAPAAAAPAPAEPAAAAPIPA